MKMTQGHFNYLSNAIEKTGINIKEWHEKYKAQGLSDMRFRWDLFWAANISEWACKALYSYLNDGCIDTALKIIVENAKK